MLLDRGSCFLHPRSSYSFPQIVINYHLTLSSSLTFICPYYKSIDMAIFIPTLYRYRVAEVRYLRPEETHKGKLVAARVETSVIYLPDVWSCEPTHLEWETLQLGYKKQLQKKLAQLEGKEDGQAEHILHTINIKYLIMLFLFQIAMIERNLGVYLWELSYCTKATS